MSPSRRQHQSDGGSAPRSVFQYLDILRDRWISASIAFAVVAGLVATHALFSTPTYASRAMIQLDTGTSGGDSLGEIALFNSQANVEAELEVMRSYSVARQAAIEAQVGVAISQENAYRPWNSLLRSLAGGDEPTRLKASVVDGGMPEQGGSFRVTFDAAGTSFVLQATGSEEDLGTHAFAPEGFTNVEIQGAQIALALDQGDTAGRTFLLQLRTEEQAALWVREMVRAKQVGNFTGIVHLGVETENPYLAQRLADALSESYTQHKKAHRSKQVDSRITWLKAESKKQNVSLKAALDARDNYITTHGAVLLGEKATAAFEAQSRLFEQRLQQEQILMELTTSLDALQGTRTPDKVLAAIGGTNVDAQTQAIADSLVQFEVERGVLLRGGRTTEDLKVKGLEAEIAEARAMLDKRISALRGEVEAQIKRRISAVNNRLKQIGEEVARHDAVLADLPAEERALAELTRNVETAQASYVFLERMKGEAELAKTSTQVQAHVVDKALLLTARQSPVLYQRALVAIFLGLFAACGMALLRHARDRTVQSPGDLEEGLGLQLYAAIPEFSSVPRRQRKGLVSSLVVRDAPQSTLTENYRTLRANIRFADTGEPIQALAITSALPKEGKTVTTLNLAMAMALAGNSVIVVDADLRRPMVSAHLQGEAAPGIVEVLRGDIPWRDTVQASEVKGLSFIAAGRKLKDPSALLEAGHFATMLKEMREEYEYILFDVPPVLAVADAAAFFRSLDAVFLVARQGACPRDIVAGARDQVRRLGGNLTGAIFNGFDAKRAGSRRYGYGGYGGYSGYYAYHAGDDEAEGDDPERSDGSATQGVASSATEDPEAVNKG